MDFRLFEDFRQLAGYFLSYAVFTDVTSGKTYAEGMGFKQPLQP